MTSTRFQPGQSGNANGRPPGSGEVARLRAAIGEHLSEIIMKLVEQAKAGDAQSARLLLERVLPPMKAAELPTLIHLPEGSLSDQGKAVLDAAGAGELAPTQAAQLLGSLAALAKLIETDELARRIDVLEARSNEHPHQSN